MTLSFPTETLHSNKEEYISKTAPTPEQEWPQSGLSAAPTQDSQTPADSSQVSQTPGAQLEATAGDKDTPAPTPNV